MAQHVTAGVDATAEGLAAAHWAAREALRRGAGLRLVHAWRGQPGSVPPVSADTARRHVAERTLRRSAASVRAAHPGLRVEDVLLSDSPVTVLLAVAEEAEVLVLGSHGLGRIAGFALGSVSQRVLARSSCPVVLVRAGETNADEHLPALDGVSPEEIPETPYRDVVLGLDTEHLSDELLGFAFESARRRGSGLRVIHAMGVVPAHADDGPPDTAPAGEPLTGRDQVLLAALRPWCEKFPRVLVTETVAEGRAAAELVHASACASLLVVGRRTRNTRLGPHIGSVTHAVLHHARCPVAVVPHT
ncbi:universal stress protein [Streptomyces glomeratus]|uniref:Universal stress protein n=1 Tax=Streptomyces glomeratus TaxID=284452 RepID=A0ABP6LCF6_9ACTN|nr:universal stress protein [Streptomyces glomeratus]MCF1508804.1 universal stress protein [Streptomyces glomeratus]